jgi:hypothetical protein
MTKSSESQLARRINAALLLLKKFSSDAKAVAGLVKRHRVSRRQAYRYVQEAKATGHALPIPERKVPFTVKLPMSLARRFRQMARSTGESLSALVTRALESFLQREGHG